MEITNYKNYVIVFLSILSITSIGWIVVTRVMAVNETGEIGRYHLISEDIAWLNAKEFAEKQKNLEVSYSGMKTLLVKYFDEKNLNGRYSLYFEDLNSGAWIGIDERTKFYPASLLKLPTMVAVLKKVEVGETTLDQEVTLTSKMLDDQSGTLYAKGEGYRISVENLITYLVRESDNTALMALDSLLTEEEYNSARLAMGLSPWKNGTISMLSPKEYSNMLRSLYLSTYLRRDFSELALSILSKTTRRTQLAAGVPEGINVAHKYGEYENFGVVHDCGIVYAKESYILCIMSHNSTEVEGNTVIRDLSSQVYDYVARER